MALLKAARVADVPNLDVVAPGLVVDSASASAAKEHGASGGGRFSVIGHRGKGMNALASADRRLQEVRENTVRSFNDAARFPVDYVEFDVQVMNTGVVPRLTLLPFVLADLQLQIHDAGIHDEGLGMVSAWIEIDLPHTTAGEVAAGTITRAPLYGPPADTPEDALECLAQAGPLW